MREWNKYLVQFELNTSLELFFTSDDNEYNRKFLELATMFVFKRYFLILTRN